jgi:RNA polymerase primary sigma factor
MRRRGAESGLEGHEVRDLLMREIGFVPHREFEGWNKTFRLEDLTAWLPAPAPARSPQSNRYPMPAHLEQLCAAPLLKPEDERQWFLKMNFLRFRANALRVRLQPARASAKQVHELQQLLAAAEAIRNHIAHSNTRLVISIVKQFADDRNPFDDLLSEGISCLVRSVEKFDAGRGFRFSTYATRAVRRDVFRLVQKAHRDRQRQASATGSEIEASPEERLDDSRPEAKWDEIGSLVGQLMNQLDERERFIIEARYGFDRVGGKPTFQRLGELLGVSKERVRQLEQRALDKLKAKAEEMKMDEPTW